MNAATVTPVEEQAGPVLDPLADETVNTCFALTRDHRAHLNGRIEPVAYPNRSGRIDHASRELALSAADHYGYGDGQASLARAAECAVRHDTSGAIQIGIRKNQHVILCSALALRPLALCGRFGVDIFGDRR